MTNNEIKINENAIKFNEYIQCNEPDLNWYISLLDRDKNISLNKEEIKRLEKVEEHLMICFTCQDKILELEINET